MMRSVLGAIAGVLVAVVMALAVGWMGDSLFPYPAEVSPRTMQEAVETFPAAPFGAKLFIVLAWFMSSLAGGAVAKMIARGSGALWVTTGVMTVLAVGNIFLLPMPVWMQISAFVLPVLGGVVANHLIRLRPPAHTEPVDAEA